MKKNNNNNNNDDKIGTIPWDNYIMRKYGQSIRKKILDAYIPFAKAIVQVKVGRVLESYLLSIPDEEFFKA
jgi:hypothetical protein